MTPLVARMARAYLTYFPIERGKWRLWSLLYARLRQVRFPAALYPLKHGVTMYLDPEQYVDQHCFYWGVWEPDETRVILRLLRPGDTVIDVGANVGYFTLLAATQVGPTGRVFAVEPVPPTVRRLKQNVEHSGLANITICPCAAVAVSDTVRIARRGVGDVSGQNTMRPSAAADTFWSVDGVTLDAQVPRDRPVRLIKLDAEGAELLALRGATAHLQGADGPFLLCEVTDQYLRELGGSAGELWSLLEAHGYRYIYDCRRARLRPVLPSALAAEPQLNVLFSKVPAPFA